MTPLMEPFDKEFVGTNVKEIEYDGKNMNAPQTLLDYLDHSLNQVIVSRKFTKAKEFDKKFKISDGKQQSSWRSS